MSGYPLLPGDVVLSEAVLQERLHERLLVEGFEVVLGPRILGVGRADLMAKKQGKVLMIEIKVADPLAGVGQVLAYKARWRGSCTAVLACFEDAKSEVLADVCWRAGVELWIVDRFGRYRSEEES